MKVYSVEAIDGGFTTWTDVDAESADEARRKFEKLHANATVTAVSEVEAGQLSGNRG